MKMADVQVIISADKPELTLTFIGPHKDGTDNKEVVISHFLKMATNSNEYVIYLSDDQKLAILKNLTEGIKK